MSDAFPDVRYQPKNVIATFVDDFGEERSVHRPKGRRLSVAKNSDTPAARMNRAAAILIGRRIRERRLALGMTMAELGERAGLKNANQKAYVNALEKATRQEGMRFGTLFALSLALKCEAADLMPESAEVMNAADVRPQHSLTLVSS